MLGIDFLPHRQESLEIGQRHGLDFRSQAIDCEPMDSGEEPAITPLHVRDIGFEMPAQYEAFGLKRKQASIDFGSRQVQKSRQG